MKYIEHIGVVRAVLKDAVQVEVMKASACGACQAKGVCSSEQELRIITVKLNDPSIVVGSQVTVIIEERTGELAVLLAYFLPLFVFVAMFFIFLATVKNEGLAGLLALFSLAPYFSSLWVFRERMSHSLKVYIKNYA